MIDLTPLDVRKKRGDFRRILRGYDPEEVDTFMDLVAERFEELVRENLSLREATERLGRQLEALEGREKAVQEALVTAQKLRAEVGDQSRREAEVLRGQATRMAEVLKAEAGAEIQRRLAEAEALIKERQRALEDLERSRLKFLKSFRGLLEREMDAVDVEESRRPLEETPLELEFRGWTPSGGNLEFGFRNDEFEEDEPVAQEVVPLPAPALDEVQVLDGEQAPEEEPTPEEATILEDPGVENEPSAPEAVSNGESGPTENEEEPRDPWSAAADFPTAELDDADVPDDRPEHHQPGGFETQILEGAAPANLSPGPVPEDPVETEEDASPVPQEPRWLFSLLKKDEEKGGEV